MSLTAQTIRVSASVTEEQSLAIEDFRETEALPTKADAVRLLLEIALDAIAANGRRFWDRAPAE